MSSRDSRQQGPTGPGQIHNQQGGGAAPPPQPGGPSWGPPPSYPPPQTPPPNRGAGPGPGPQGPQGLSPQVQQDLKKKDPSASYTLFRTANFFVHSFSPRMRTGSLARAGGEGTILERIRWTSAEKQRLVSAQTRLLPQIDTFNAAQWREIPIPVWFEGFAVALVLAVTLVIQAFNVFNAPTYTADEGNVMSNAWAILQGKIVPYIYTYDHPPLGWIQVAAWARITGGIASFGNAINSGRILMLIMAVGSSLLVYLITSRLSGSRSAAFLAMVLYSLAPLSLQLRHEVLLVNIGVFWLLLSFCLITTGKSKLLTFLLAAIALGIAILSDGIFLFFLPVMFYSVWLYATPFQRKFSLVAFVYATLAIASSYGLLALLQQQVLPTNDPSIDPSLVGELILKWQMVPPVGQFSMVWNSWMQSPADMLLILVGTGAMFLNILGGTVNRYQLLGALFAATAWIIILASKTLYDYSIVPLLPFLAINIAMALNIPLRWVTRKVGFDLVRVLLLFILIGILLPAGVQAADPLTSLNATQPQQQAMLWMRDNATHDAVVITNSYMFADFQDPQGEAVGGGQPFTHAQIFTDAVFDPAISFNELHQNWENIDFLVLDNSMLKTIRVDRRFNLLNEALHHGLLRETFGSTADGSQIQIYQVIH